MSLASSRKRSEAHNRVFSSSPWNRNHDQQGFAFNVASARKAIPQEQIAIKLFKEKIKKKQIKSKKAKEKIQKKAKLDWRQNFVLA